MFHKNIFKTLAVCLGLILGTVACSKEEDEIVRKSGLNELKSFQFLSSKNSTLSADIDGVIDSDKKEITVNFPTGVDLSANEFAPTFSISEKATFKIGDKTFTSGETKHSFTAGSDLDINVIAENGDKAQLTLKITQSSSKPSPSAGQATFDFLDDTGIWNSGYLMTYTYTASEKKMYMIMNGGLFSIGIENSSDKTEITKVSDAIKNDTKKDNYLLVHNDYIYYNNASDKKIYRVKKDGTGKELFIEGYGQMSIKGGYLYFFRAGVKGRYSTPDHLFRVILDKSKGVEKMVDNCNCNYKTARSWGGRGYIVKGSYIFHTVTNDYLYRTNISTKAKETWSNGLFDTFLLGENYIVLREHFTGYGLSYGTYDQVKASKYNASKLKIIVDTDDKYKVQAGSFNVSKRGAVFIKGWDGKDWYGYVKKDKKPPVITKIKENLMVKAEPKIIGDYAFLIEDDKSGYLKLYKIALDGSDSKLHISF